MTCEAPSSRYLDQDAEEREIELTECNGAENGAEVLVLHLPDVAGSYTWTARFNPQERNGVLHEGSLAQFSLDFQPHATSIAVWDVPSPVVVSTRATIKVGVKCSANCSLAGSEIEICDQQGTRVGIGILGDLPWPAATSALYWTEVAVEVPDAEGHHRWTVRFPESGPEHAHGPASHSFGFTTTRRPEHIVTVAVVDEETKRPVAGADVLLAPYRARTDAHSVATIEAPKGNYKLRVTKRGHEAFQSIVSVASDFVLQTELPALAPQLLEDS